MKGLLVNKFEENQEFQIIVKRDKCTTKGYNRLIYTQYTFYFF